MATVVTDEMRSSIIFSYFEATNASPAPRGGARCQKNKKAIDSGCLERRKLLAGGVAQSRCHIRQILLTA